jgi:hypothetical protein
MRRPQMISSPVILKEKLEMVEALADIQLAKNLMKSSTSRHGEKRNRYIIVL